MHCKVALTESPLFVFDESLLQPTISLRKAVEFVYNEFYNKQYEVMGLSPAEQQELAPAFFMDAAPVHGVERPNHGLGNAIRKAQLVPLVASACVYARDPCRKLSFGMRMSVWCMQ